MKTLHAPRCSARPSVRNLLLAMVLALGSAAGAHAIIPDLTLVKIMHQPAFPGHTNQQILLGLVQGGQGDVAFQVAFENGDLMFQTKFNAIDGVGANVGKEQRFTRVPRADLRGPKEWFNHVPPRPTGPNAEACSSCHRVPAEDGSGDAVDNVHRDPLRNGSLAQMIQRNTPHLFGAGAIQKLAEEITFDLQKIRDDQIANACATGSGFFPLLSKGLNFGTIRVTRTQVNPCQVNVDTSGVVGVASDLVVRPFQWKGSVAFLRDFNRTASHNEIGMQAVELVDAADGDGDSVINEMTIGDQTAFAIYIAAQPRPVTKQELSDLGLLDPPLTSAQYNAIEHGKQVFREVGCNSCHAENLHIADPIFREPSSRPAYRDATFPAGQNPVSQGVDPNFPVSFDLTKDQPDNVFTLPNGEEVHLGSFEKNVQGLAVVRLFGDLKRHRMGTKLAEQIDEVGTGADSFLTENLWGVGSTAPYMHDGRATTLTEAILEHGGEAAASVTNFQARSELDQKDLIAFLENLILIKVEPE